ncbi:MAG: CDP-diacylglycerol--glycerol-3-phosphate 3-phosphatidyltransferase [Lachnospiraceae bacterium]|nr:CDP-diacylglycerol--glycerol-3-phosphate 3-phosphatidyltransferase [Lachnospiraceae bacterium]
MNTPNKLTILRMIMIIPFVILMLQPGENRLVSFAALAIFIIASLTDTLDGYLARRDNLVTDFGKFMDPLADKLLVCAAMVCLVDVHRLPTWVCIIIISREFIISGFRLVASDNGIVIAASWWGKIKTISQMLMIILLIANLGNVSNVFIILEQILIYVSTALTIISLCDYLWKNRQVISMQK